MYRRWDINLGSDKLNNISLGSIDLSQFSIDDNLLHFEIYFNFFDITNTLSKCMVFVGDIFKTDTDYYFSYDRSQEIIATPLAECGVYIGNSAATLSETTLNITGSILSISVRITNEPSEYRYGAWGIFIMQY